MMESDNVVKDGAKDKMDLLFFLKVVGRIRETQISGEHSKL